MRGGPPPAFPLGGFDAFEADTSSFTLPMGPFSRSSVGTPHPGVRTCTRSRSWPGPRGRDILGPRPRVHEMGVVRDRGDSRTYPRLDIVSARAEGIEPP